MTLYDRDGLRRRLLLQLGATGVLGTLLPLAGGSARAVALAPTGPQGRVVVVGGGMAGATTAKYLRLWGGAGVQVTLVEPEATYTSNIMSNLVLNGSRTVQSLLFSRATLASNYGVVRRAANLIAIDVPNRLVSLSDGGALAYDRLVLAPGVEFDDAYGLRAADYEARTPHAWRAGPQTDLLRQQVAAMTDGGICVITIPRSPYRCPPGPYERACLIADYLKTHSRRSAKVLVLDENAGIQAEAHTFTNAFQVVHAGIIQYVPSVTGIAIDPATRVVRYTDAAGAAQSVAAQVVNPIPPHRAAGSGPGGWLAAAGLNNGADGRWAVVDVRTYASTVAGASAIHVIGDAAQTGLPKAGHIANQEGKVCADAIVRALGGQPPEDSPVVNSMCYSPVTAGTASWLSAVFQYDPATRSMRIAGMTAAGPGQLVRADGTPMTPTESATVSSGNFSQMNTWFRTLMADTLA